MALSCLSLAFSRLSCSVSSLICSISISISRTGRQLRVDKNDRHRGSDEGDSPLLLETDAAAEDGDVVIGGKESDQAEKQTATGLDGTEVIQAGPGALWICQFWRSWGRLAVSGSARDAWSGGRHRGREAIESPALRLTSSTLCSAQACSPASTGRLISSNIGDLLDKSTDRILIQQISNRSNSRRLLLAQGEAHPNTGPP